MPCLASSITRARISRSRSITTWCRKACGRTRGLRPATRSKSSPRVREGEDDARAHTPLVVPAKAGTHNPRTWLLRGLSPRVPRYDAAEYGSRLALRLAGTTINAAGRVRMQHALRQLPPSSPDLIGRSSTPRPLLPSPLWGPRRAKLALEVGGGGQQQRSSTLPPSPTLPHKGGGSAASKRGEGADCRLVVIPGRSQRERTRNLAPQPRDSGSVRLQRTVRNDGE